MRKTIWVGALVILMISILAACGSRNEGKSSVPANGPKIVVQASNWKYDKKEYTIPANKDVTIELKSNEGMHGLMIEGQDFELEGNDSKTVKLKPGTYTIRCSVPCGDGHTNMYAKLVAE